MELSSHRKEIETMQVFWFLPTHGDGRYLGSGEQARTVNHAYLKQIAQAADELGFVGVLLPTGRSCEDAWVVASTLVPVTTKLKFLVAIRPGIISPTAAARMAATFDRLSDGRLLINVVTGGDPDEALGDGIFLTHDERYEVTEEFLQVWREAVAGKAISLNGKAHSCGEREGAVSVRPEAASPALFRGIVESCLRFSRTAGRCLSHVGRTSATG